MNAYLHRLQGASVRALIIAGLTLIAGSAWPNGESFFLQTMEAVGDPSYVLYGSVKDGDGHYLKNATVTVAAPEHVLKVSAQTDELGRFRAPDIGRAINELGYEVDPGMIKVTVEYPGFHVARMESRGKTGQKKGAIEVDFLLDKNAK